MSFENLNILITGAGKGIGFECVKNFTNKGAFVYALVRNKEDSIKFKKLNKNKFKIFYGDVRLKKNIIKIFNDSSKYNRRINGLLNNAGIRFRKKFTDISHKEILNVFENNFFSVFYLCQFFSNYLIKNKIKGSIVNIGSIVGNLGFSELSAYASSKGALSSLTRSIAVELAKKNIRVNTISPGFTKTSYYNKFIKKKKLFNWTISRTPMGRWGEVKEISELAAFLLSDKSSFITGENINIDGGWSAS
jgi:NAD(P)-dependent dehydrogenase (short-subunit alcohol dehydrogenase family)